MNSVEVNGVKLEVERLESAQGARRSPLVFLHEGLGSVALWGDWPARLCAATGRSGVVYSRRGYGQSDPVPDARGAGRFGPEYMHREAIEVLPALLEILGIETPVLIGHSDGGTIALLHAARFKVRACVVMAPHVVVEELTLQAIEQAKTAFQSGKLRHALQRYHANVDGAFWLWNDIWLSQQFRDFDIRAECRAIRHPVLAIQGLDDPYGTLRQIEEIGPSQGPLTLETLAQCGHAPQRDQPERTTGSIVRFLQSLG